MEKRALGRGLDALLPSTKSTDGLQPGGELYELAIDSIVPNRFQPRQEFPADELAELADSVKQNGLLQPVLVRRKGDGLFELIAGERRLRAARMAGLDRIPALVRNCGDEESMALALVENLQRTDLNPIDVAKGYYRMMNEFGLTQDIIAQRIGSTRSSVANVLRLLHLPFEVQQLIEKEELSIGHAKVLLSLSDPGAQLRLARQIVTGRLSVRDAEKLVQREAMKGRRRGGSARHSPASDLEQQLQKRLGTRVNIVRKGSGGRIVIHFFSWEELDGLLESLLK